MEATIHDDGDGHIDAVNFSTRCFFGGCNGSGPWVQADLENGLFQGDKGTDTFNKGDSSTFVTALLKNNNSVQADIVAAGYTQPPAFGGN